jgi:hypothetical protein
MNRDRSRVVIAGCESSWKDVISGVPQGSVLGPILFLIYINDIVENLSCPAYLFADDMKIFCGVTSGMDNCRLQSDLDRIVIWTEDWLLKLNAPKCKTLTLGRVDKSHPFRYLIQDGSGSGQVLASVTEEKDLGVLIDRELRFNTHVYSKIKTANRMIGLIRRNFKNIDFEGFLLLYKALVRSHLEYAQTVWSPYRTKLIDALEGVQRRATKILPGLRNLPYRERLSRLKLPTLVYRRARGDMVETFKIIQGYYDPDGVPTLQRSTYSSTRGHDKKLFKQQSHLDARKFSFTVRVASVWNSLPADVVNSPSVAVFERRLDKYWAAQECLYNYKALIKC